MPADRDALAPADDTIEPRPSEQCLIDCLDDLAGQTLLCTSAGVAQLALAAAARQARVHCHYLDLYQAERARRHAGLAAGAKQATANLTIECEEDFPDIAADVVALPLSSSGEAELARDLLQTGHQRLRTGGRLLASTDNPRDTWLAEQMQRLFSRVERRAMASGVVYVATKTGPLKKLKNFFCEFTFRDREKLLKAYSRPGVFAHRRVDPGARQMLNVMEVEAGQRVLDLGCGSGVLSLAASSRAAGVLVHSVDSNARAVACTARGAALNGLENISTELNADGNFAGQGSYDLALANPPYFANFRIARHFVLSAHRALKPGARLLVVTKFPAWYAEHLPNWYRDVQLIESKQYFIASGIKAG